MPDKKDSGIVEVVIYGRGGQGAKTAGELVAQAALMEGKFAQAFPEYGPERRGAPTRAFVRISNKEIRTHEPILNPDYVVVLDSTLLSLITMKDAIGIVNSKEPKSHFRKNFSVDATSISYDILQKAVPNTVMVGSFARVSKAVRIDTLLKITEGLFSKKYGGPIVEKNLEMVRRGFDEVKSFE
jgi:pyruvate ferredoxin oxidoreductase gamma subunit